MGVGCVSSKSPHKQNDTISTRSIEPENQPPTHHHGIDAVACGYGFDLDDEELGHIMARHQAVKKKQIEMDKFQMVMKEYIQLKKAYQEHIIDTCFQLLKSLKKNFSSINFTIIDMVKGQRQQIECLINLVEEQYSQMLKFQSFLNSSGWQDQGDYEGIRLYTRRQEGTVGTLMIKEIQLPVQIFLTILAQMDYYSDLIKDIPYSKQQKYLARNHKIGSCVFNFPIVSKRQAVFQAIGYNRLKHNNTIFMYSHSIHNKPQRCKQLEFKPNLDERSVIIDYKYFVIKYVPVAKDRGQVSIALNIDMKINFVPISIMEFVCKQFCRDFFNVVMDASHKFKGSKWEAKAKKHPDTFNFFKNIMVEYFENNGYGYL